MIFEVTGAALSPDGTQLALLGATRLWLFSQFGNGRFFDGNVQRINFSGISQKEALDFESNSRLYIGNESSPLGVAQLRVLDRSTVLSQKATASATLDLRLSPNPAREQVRVQMVLPQAQKLCLQVYSQEGRFVKTWLRETAAAGRQQWNFSVRNLPTGVYYLHLLVGKERFLKRLVVQQ